ncbi:hypothetical protein CCHR01_04569 [Colletotrichum chrysophilum]|uniref:Uncharacterized protein n=1 Tax=Colletotrichum chrysophilum TaxID=1836956 RepID=A0AAD9ELL3_9PEZI|nr:hypothetical protein CCHR01_04569 [Colletotrichum chrysophilum]
MPLLIPSEVWAKWKPVLEELHAEYEFPVNTKSELNVLLSCYGGEGISFCTNQDHWRFTCDIVRSGDNIEEITTICVIRRPERGKVADGWLITQTCKIHGPQNADKVVDDRNIGWFRITGNGHSYQHCCGGEITGPYITKVSWGNWDVLRLRVNHHWNVQQIASLRQQLQERQSEKLLKRKVSLVDLTEDDTADSPTVKKLRKSKAKYKDGKAEAEDRAAAAEDRASAAESRASAAESRKKSMEQEIETLRGELIQKKMLVTKKDKAIDDLRRQYAIKDVSLQNLREEVARQKKNIALNHNEDLNEHLKSAMKIEDDKAIELATENTVLKGVVDRQKTDIKELEGKLTHRNRCLVEYRREKKRLEYFILEEVPQYKIPVNLLVQAGDSDTHAASVISTHASDHNGNIHPDRQALVQTPSAQS